MSAYVHMSPHSCTLHHDIHVSCTTQMLCLTKLTVCFASLAPHPLLSNPLQPMHNCLQAERWGSELYTEDVEHVDLSSRPFTVRTSDTQVLSSQAMMLWTPCTAYPPPPPAIPVSS